MLKKCIACGREFVSYEDDAKFCGHCKRLWRISGIESVPMKWRKVDEILQWFEKGM